MTEFDNKKAAEGRPSKPSKVYKRWITELDLASKAEKDWRKEVTELLDLYRGKDAKLNSYNMLWANTEITRPALYNSKPHADVRRRFRDADPLGKAMSEVMKRALDYTMDVYGYDAIYRLAVLDLLLPGRAVMRLRYKPQMDGDDISWECVMPELVQWDDYRHGPGKTRPEIPWDAFKHQLTREELVAKFGDDIGNEIELDATDEKDETLSRMNDEDEVKNAFKTAVVWEIWDKLEKQVIFIAPSYNLGPCLTLDDPLGIDEFVPMPPPLMAVEDSSSTTPIPIFRLYKQQAEELNRLSSRINKIIEAIKFRGIYDSTITEMEQLLNAGDNSMVPSQSTSRLIENGGLERGIWTWPVNTIAQVLQYLYDARERTKAVIYELTGISDVVRGSSKASETLGAQQLKSQYAGVRLQKMQSAIQNFIRDSLSIAGGIIAEKFQQETLIKMTGLPYPTDEQVEQQYQQQMMQWQQQAQQMQMQFQLAHINAQQTGQPLPPAPQIPPQPQPPEVITWEKIISALRDNPTRSYRIDIETDSTIQALVESDMEGLGQVGQAVNMIAGSFMPYVEKGFMPIEAVKEMIGAVTRRARMGNAVEDSLEKMQAPQQPQNEAAQKAQEQLQQDQQKLQQSQQKVQQTEAQQQKMDLDLTKRELDLKSREQAISFSVESGEKRIQMDTEAQQLTHQGAIQKLEKLAGQIELKIAEAEKKAGESGDGQKVEESQQMMGVLAQTMQQIAEALVVMKQPQNVTVTLPSGRTATRSSM